MALGSNKIKTQKLHSDGFKNQAFHSPPLNNDPTSCLTRSTRHSSNPKFFSFQ